MNNINIDIYRDKVLGCWTGKNIGGTLGAPDEGKRETNNLEFYKQALSGVPAPNDDLDLQLIWLHAISEHGIKKITSRLLGEYWLGDINGPWNEYGVAKANMRAGLMPPLSGSCNNERWKYSNGAWIRSEIWACCFPGNPDMAIKYAYMDACVDHCGEGIYAEMFTAALQSAAFIISDIEELISIGLSKIPEGCRIARSVKIAVDGYKKGASWLETREKLVEDSSDLGWFQAPANIGFTVIGLMYGEGDFGKTICRAVNCGDDTDCTGATAGAIMGIIRGRGAIPQKWLEPIGESIQNVCLNTFLRVPKTLRELTGQTIDEAIKINNVKEYPLNIESGDSSIEKSWIENLKNKEAAREIHNIPPYELSFDLPHIKIAVDYLDGPNIKEGVEKKIKIKVDYKNHMFGHYVSMKWRLPEEWDATLGVKRGFYLSGGYATAENIMTITPGPLEGGFIYIEVEIRDRERENPYIIVVPFQCDNTIRYSAKAK